MGSHLLRRWFPVVAPCVLLALAGSPHASDEAVLLLEDSSGTYELQGQRRLVIQDLRGTASLRLGKPGVLRFEGRASNRRDKLPAYLWQLDDKTLALNASGGEDGEVFVEIAVPPELKVEAFLEDSRFVVAGLQSDVLFEGARTDVQIRGVRGAVEIKAEGGELLVSGVAGDTDLEAVDVQGRLQQLSGNVTLDLKNSRITASVLEGALQGEIVDSEFAVQTVGGPLTLDANGGTLSLSQCNGGGRLRLDDTPLNLRLSKSELEVRTDSSVDFSGHEGPLTILGYGAAIKGSQSKGPIKLETDTAEVVLQAIAGDTEIVGSGLTLNVQNVKGLVTIVTSSSQVRVHTTVKEVKIENDYGDVEVGNASGPVSIKSRDGIVRVTQHAGPLTIDADGPEVDVAWAKLEGQVPVKVHNEGGDVRLSLPGTGRCDLRASAPHGRIESDFPGIHISDDGHEARGEFSGTQRPAPQLRKPTIEASSGAGNLYLGSAAAAGGG